MPSTEFDHAYGALSRLQSEFDHAYAASSRIQSAFEHAYEAKYGLEFDHAYKAKAQANFDHAYQAKQGMPPIFFDHAYASTKTIKTSFDHAYNSGDGVTFFDHAYSSVQKHDPIFFDHSYACDGPLIEIPPAPGTSDPPTYTSAWELASMHNVGDLNCQFLIRESSGAVHDLGEVPYQFVVHENLSAPGDWALNIIDKDGRYHPETTWSDWHEVMDEYPLNADNSARKEIVMTAKWGEQEFNYRGVPTAWGSNREPIHRVFNFSWKGVDHSQKWLADYVSLPVVRSNRSNGYKKNTDVLKEMCELTKMDYDLSQISKTFYVPVMYRSSDRVMSYIGQILSTVSEEYIMVDGHTFTPFYPDDDHPTIEIDLSNRHVQEEALEATAQEIYNYIVYARAAETGGASVSKTMDVYAFNGDYTVEFDEPMAGVTWSYGAEALGIFSDFLIKDPDGNVSNIREVRAGFGASTYGVALNRGGPMMNVKSIQFSWGARSGVVAAGGPGQITFVGTPYPPKDKFDLFPTTTGTADDPLPSFRSEAIDPDSQARFGVRRLEIQPNPLCPSQEISDLAVARLIRRLARRSRSGAYRVALNPRIKPGVVVKEIDAYRGVIRHRLVLSTEHAYSKSPSLRYTKYSGIVRTNWV